MRCLSCSCAWWLAARRRALTAGYNNGAISQAVGARMVKNDPDALIHKGKVGRWGRTSPLAVHTSGGSLTLAVHTSGGSLTLAVHTCGGSLTSLQVGLGALGPAAAVNTLAVARLVPGPR